MNTATEQRIIDMARISKMYRSDHRARQIIDMAVAHGINEHGDPEDRNYRRFAHEVATTAVTALLQWIYDNYAEINRLGVERDHYKKLAAATLRMVPPSPIVIASVDTHAKRGDSTQIEAPSPMGSAVGVAETPTRSRQSNKPGREM